MDIIEEYSDLVSDLDQKELLHLRKEHFKVDNKLQIIQQIIYSLDLLYNPELCQCLRNMGFRMKYTEVTIKDDLRKTVSQCQQLIHKRDELTEQINKKVGGEQVKESDFDAMIIEYSSHLGYHIDENVFTISKYAAAKNSYQSKIEALKNQTSNQPN